MNALAGGLVLILGLLAADHAAHPRQSRAWRLRSGPGVAILLATGALLFGIYLAIIGAWAPAMVLVFLSAGVFPLISNVKRQVLGEPLVFSDLALIGAVFKHPHFYISALKPGQIVIIVAGVATLIGVAAVFVTADWTARAVGLGIAIVAAVCLKALGALPIWHECATRPDLNRDVRDHGLIATLFVYWQLWSRLAPLAVPARPAIAGETPQLVVVIQCESFGDPAALFADPGAPLAGLAKARANAWSSGRLMVPGFGAYTMRTEFGALFGIDEDELGLRRFDPFLTAEAAANVALPRRFEGPHWSRFFVHPHDMRFYGRDRLMPAAGFDALVGEEAFAPPAPHEGRYVTDAALCDKIIEIAAGGEKGSTLIYAVTIENHGPWSSTESGGLQDNKAGYLRLLGHSDAMLMRLLDELPRLGRPMTLCFFGDHRPSIPGVCSPGGDRHTPFVIVKTDAHGVPVPLQDGEQDLTAAQLHHEILRAVASG